jgi:outer membrane protein assembly factor BamB
LALVAATLGAMTGTAPAQQGGQSSSGTASGNGAAVGELLYSTEGNRLRRYDVDTIGTANLVQDVLVPSASDDQYGRDMNGEICFVPDGSGRFVNGEDTGQPNPPAGWGIFDYSGNQVGKLTATYFVDGAEPHGCEFAADGTLFTSEVGFQGFGTSNGQLIMWFPNADGSFDGTAGFCKLATDLGTAGSVALDQQGRVYVTQAAGLSIERFTGPFPTGPDAAGGCGGVDSTGAPVADTVQRETFASPSDGMLTFFGVALAPNGNIYASSVVTGHIAEYDLDGNVVRLILAPDDPTLPLATGSPQGLAVGGDGTIYYADSNLVGELPNVGTGPNGKVWRIRFDENGDPLAPELVREGLRFPDGVAIAPGNLERPEPQPGDWPSLAGGPDRSFFNPNETWLTADRVGDLVEKWSFPTQAVVTASPSVTTVTLPNGAAQRIVLASSWDGFIYAINFDTGDEVWRYAWVDQPGSSFPAAGSVTVADVAGQRLALVGAGQTMHALDAATGEEVWTFAAGTGCRDSAGNPPGLCSFEGERNQIESTPLVTNGTVYFGMDINDVATGKGGFYALDAETGYLVWYFDVETGATCRTLPGDNITNFDGYHSEAELGLPAGFFASRPGCDHDRQVTGCGNVWSSPAHDPHRHLLYFGTSNCDTDNDPNTPEPGPTMPAYDEALVALGTDGSPAWRWRPREVDPDDLAFGAVPNLFSIDVNGTPTDVVGIGGKDGTYYVIDRDGVNERTGLAWTDAGANQNLPYWQTNVVAGGAIGGIIATASVDEASRRVTFSTAPGFDVFEPQRPTVHQLNLDTGAVVWQNTETTFPNGDASYGPTSGVPGVVMVGSVITPHLRMYDATDGTLLYDEVIGTPTTLSGIASGPAVVDGTLVVGGGIGTRTSSGSSPGDFSANAPSAVVALCVPGSPGCHEVVPKVTPGVVEVHEGDSGTVTALVPVSLTFPTAQRVTSQWRVDPELLGTDGDAVITSGEVVFEPGETHKVVEISIIGDRHVESDEYVVIRFFDFVNGRGGGYWGLGFVNILNDD